MPPLVPLITVTRFWATFVHIRVVSSLPYKRLKNGLIRISEKHTPRFVQRFQNKKNHN